MNSAKPPLPDVTPPVESSGSMKREYVTPVLVCLGTVADMTLVNNDTATIPDRGSS
jgi:hypothetical protein